MEKVFITNIKRFAVHDGNGIRTTVFFKGCPLRCVWCHNPETYTAKREIAFYAHKCIGCGECEKVCESGAVSFDNLKTERINRARCTFCGNCAAACPREALEIIGEPKSPEEVFSAVKEDKAFYEESGGGVTLSGGECLLYPEFSEKLLKMLKAEGINTAVDTAGYVKREAISRVMPFTDTFLYDIKAMDENLHIKLTGKSNKIILENLEYINSKHIPTEIRIPFVPEYNKGEIPKIGSFLSKLSCLVGVRLLPYHNYAETKYSSLGIKNTLPKTLPAEEEINSAKKKLESFGLVCL